MASTSFRGSIACALQGDQGERMLQIERLAVRASGYVFASKTYTLVTDAANQGKRIATHCEVVDSNGDYEDLQVAVRASGLDVFASAKTGDGRFTLVTDAGNQGNALVSMTSVTDAVTFYGYYTLTVRSWRQSW